MLIAVPNGGARNGRTGAILKAEGVVAGVADLILFVARDSDRDGGSSSHALMIEMKTSKGKQSKEQKVWEQCISLMGYTYTVCRSLEDFIVAVESCMPSIYKSRAIYS